MSQLGIGLLRLAALATTMMAGSMGIAAAGEALVKSGDKIVFLGDSITAAGNWPGGYITLTAIGLQANGIDVKAINAGIGGNRSREMLARLDRDVLSQKPDWMTLSCGVNDQWGVSLDEFKANVTKIVERAEAAHVKVMILTATGGGDGYSSCLRRWRQRRNAFWPTSGFLTCKRPTPTRGLSWRTMECIRTPVDTW